MTTLFSTLAASAAREKVRLISVTGGGGKSSLLYGLGRHLALSCKVLLTTTTKIWLPSQEDSPTLFVGSALLTTDFLSKRGGNSLFTAGKGVEKQKLIGYSPVEVDRIKESKAADIVISECDGSRGRSVKFYESWEPPVPSLTDWLVAVAGTDPLMREADEDAIFRANKFRALHNTDAAPLSVEVFVSYLLHADGPLRNAPASAKKILLLNKWELPDEDIKKRLTEKFPALLSRYDMVAGVSIKENKLYISKER